MPRATKRLTSVFKALRFTRGFLRLENMLVLIERKATRSEESNRNLDKASNPSEMALKRWRDEEVEAGKIGEARDTAGQSPGDKAREGAGKAVMGDKLGDEVRVDEQGEHGIDGKGGAIEEPSSCNEW
mmetsp:Transcript_62806/g.146222  ORF Transcript_62806/g.146222 Transcript_62806/m.146222 type:complete len:128 (+) Transcript_62806:205-588(+)